MIKYTPATIRYFIKLYRNVGSLELQCDAAEAVAGLSVGLDAVAPSERSALSSLPCFFQQTRPDKHIKIQKGKLRSYFLLRSGSLSVS